MNINDFNTTMHQINRNVDLADFKLEYDKNFPCTTRRKFNEALNQINQLLERDIDHSLSVVPAWQTARRIVEFRNLFNKISGIRKKIFSCCKTPYFANKIRSGVLPQLSGRITKLKKTIGKWGRLPFGVGRDRKKFHREVQQSLLLNNSAKISQAQKEFFHLMGNHLEKSIEKEIDVESYDGSLEVYSLESWEKVIKAFIEKGGIAEKQIGGIILNTIQESLPLAVKTSYAYNLPQVKRPDTLESEIAYYTDLASLSGKFPKMTQLEFTEKYQLANSSSIPKGVIINEMAWDMVGSIMKLAKGELALFALGTKTHSIAVQVSCLEPGNLMQNGVYEWTIFNTGERVSANHQLDKSGKYAYPLRYTLLPLSAFSYTFCADLLALSFDSRSVDQFYKLHDNVLVSEYGGTKVKDRGMPYFLQLFGTCTYSAIEAWIESLLQPEQRKLLELVKTQMSVSKQEEIVHILEGEDSMELRKEANNKKRIYVALNPSQSKVKNLQENRIMLARGRKYLNSLMLLMRVVSKPKLSQMVTDSRSYLEAATGVINSAVTPGTTSTTSIAAS